MARRSIGVVGPGIATFTRDYLAARLLKMTTLVEIWVSRMAID